MSEQQEARSALLAARYARANDAVTTIAAPLLASGGVALIGVVSADEDKFRWPGPALLLVTLATILLVSCVQWGFRARPYLYSMADVEQQHGGALTVEQHERYVHQHALDIARWQRTTALADASYTAGLIALGLGVALVLAPPTGGTHVGWRWTAFAAVLLAVAMEAAWTLLERGDLALRAWQRRRRLRQARAANTSNG
ncbi:hypothetical protein [Streptomyces sp. 8N706]|uniref:hypothetical protein n=1 Tax=Streptomyces sp. 8N706 TaxID=3457416 RepID=UPI003FD4677E